MNVQLQSRDMNGSVQYYTPVGVYKIKWYKTRSTFFVIIYSCYQYFLPSIKTKISREVKTFGWVAVFYTSVDFRM